MTDKNEVELHDVQINENESIAFEDCTPTLDGFKLLLKQMLEIEQPSETTKKSISELKNYIKKQDAKKETEKSVLNQGQRRI